jgi:hypothetical protein
MGRRTPFQPWPWPDLADKFRDAARRYPNCEHMVDVVDSIIAAGAEDRLAGSSSGHISIVELLVVPRPLPEPPYDVVAVRSPKSFRIKSAPGCVLIEHLTCSGHNERIERPASEAVPLFWRFMIEKYGIGGA